jgi:hypothetical protein
MLTKNKMIDGGKQQRILICIFFSCSSFYLNILQQQTFLLIPSRFIINFTPIRKYYMLLIQCFELICEGNEKRVWGLGFGVWDLGFGVWDLGFGIWELGMSTINHKQ